MIENYRDKPSKVAYRDTTWAALFEQVGKTLYAWSWLLVTIAVIGGFVWIGASIVTLKQNETRCMLRCSPTHHTHVAGECWCRPGGAPAYRPEGFDL